MTKAQAVAMSDALDARSLPYSIIMTLDATGTPTWALQLSVTHVYAGADLAALAQYSTNHGLQLSATFDQLGVV